MRRTLAATLGLLACSSFAADRPSRHFLAVSVTSYNPTAPGPAGQVLLFDRETGAQFAHFDFAGPASAPAVTPDGSGLYVVGAGVQPGVGVVDVGSATLRSFLEVPDMRGSFTVADDRVLVTTATGIAALDSAASRVLARVPCPAPPARLVYNGRNGAAYASMYGRQDLCVVTPDLDAAPPLPTPVAEHGVIDTTVMLDDNLLLVTTYAADAYRTFAVDVVSGRSAPVPSLDGAYPAALAPDDDTLLYAQTTSGTMAYKVIPGTDGFPAFAPEGRVASPFRDDRYVYTGVGGSCSTPEGPVLCSVGFEMRDPATLDVVRSFVFAPRGAALTLSAVRPFGSSVSPARRSRR